MINCLKFKSPLTSNDRKKKIDKKDDEDGDLLDFLRIEKTTHYWLSIPLTSCNNLNNFQSKVDYTEIVKCIVFVLFNYKSAQIVETVGVASILAVSWEKGHIYHCTDHHDLGLLLFYIFTHVHIHLFLHSKFQA